MDDALCVGEAYHLGGFLGDSECLVQWERALAVEPLPQRLPGDVGHDVVEQAGRLTRGEDRDALGVRYVRAVLGLRGRSGPWRYPWQGWGREP